jgi:hypothetical protein
MRTLSLTHMYVHTLTHTCVHSHSHICVHIHPHSHVRTHTYAHSYILAHVRTLTHSLTQGQRCTQQPGYLVGGERATSLGLNGVSSLPPSLLALPPPLCAMRRGEEGGESELNREGSEVADRLRRRILRLQRPGGKTAGGDRLSISAE